MNLHQRARITKVKDSKEVKTLNWELVKWAVPTIMSLIGLLLWIAGTAYEAGFWHFLGISDPPFSTSVRRTALSGLVGPISVWFNAFLCIIVSGLVFFLFALAAGAISLKVKKRPTIFNKAQVFFQRIFLQERETINFSFFLMVLGLMGALVILPLAGAIWFAHEEGISAARKEICKAKTEKNLKSTIYLSNGRKVQGNFWVRTEKLDILINRKAIFVVSAGEKQQILDSTNIEDINCGQ